MVEPQKNTVKNKIQGLIFGIEDNIRNFLDVIISNESDAPNLLHNGKYKVLKSYCDSRIPKFKEELENNDFIFEDRYYSYTIMNKLEEIIKELIDIQLNKSSNNTFTLLDKILNTTVKINDISKEISMINLSVNRMNTVIDPVIERSLTDIREKVGKMDSVLLAIELNETDKIYKNAEKRFGGKARKYEKAFYITLIITIVLFVLSLFFPVLDNNSPIFEYVKYVLSKLVIITLSVTLCTVFNRKGAHFRKLQDQAYQTHLELDAFPIHTNRLNDEDKDYLIKELALKYFGKEVDQSQNDKIGDLMKDQLTAGTELIKVSAELVKNAKTISTSVDKTKITKINNTSTEDKTKSEGDG